MTTNKRLPISCHLCHEILSPLDASTHIEKCSQHFFAHRDSNGEHSIFLIQLSSQDPYTLFVTSTDTVLLEDIDLFLRHTWLECCSHESRFTIGADFYKEDKNVSLKKALGNNHFFTYQYDPQHSTKITGEIIATYKGFMKDRVRLVARNLMPYWSCQKCDSKASSICKECNSFYCEKCFHSNKHEGHHVLPITNSPRMGICNYTGTQEGFLPASSIFSLQETTWLT